MKKKVQNHSNFIHRLFFACMLLASMHGLKSQVVIAEGFYDQIVSENYTLPVGITFDNNGVAFVWEKSGRVYTLDPSTSQKLMILDISEEVSSWGDHGLTGLALDPDFIENGKLYLAYTVDRHHLFNFGTQHYDKDSTVIKNATIGRVTRYTMNLSTFPYTAQLETRKVLIGTDTRDGFPILADFHGIGSLSFGNDGSLLVSCGDGGLDSEPGTKYHTDQALEDGIIDSTMLLGSYRSQTIHSMNGKIIRIDAETGSGLPSNPYYNETEPRSPASRTWALGLRNPYKFIHIPETGSHNVSLGDPGVFVIGDVGSSYWEEFNVLKEKATNFGWPLFEGSESVWPYGFYEIENPFAPNPLAEESECERTHFIFQELVAQDNLTRTHTFYNPCSIDEELIPDDILTYIHTRPVLYYNNVQWNQPTRSYIPGYKEDGAHSSIALDSSDYEISELFEGYSALPGAWYEEGPFPEIYKQSLFVSDFSGWIKLLQFDDNFNLEKVIPFRSDIKGIVNLTIHPIDDCIYYINILTQDVRKICFGGNPPPVAIAIADTLYGGPELLVNFDATSSYDPNQLPINIHWDFGDGDTSSTISATHLYTTNTLIPQQFSAVLTVTDSLGEIGTDTLLISLNNSPPQAKISSPSSDVQYSVNGYNRIDFKADVIDLEESPENLSCKWQVHLHHNLHFHSEEPVFLKNYSALLEPIGCGETDEFWYRVSLEVEDSYGLKDMDEVLLHPNCSEYGNIEWLRHNYPSGSVELNWRNLDIEDLDYFIVQRVKNSNTFIDLGKVAASNDNYDFLDSKPEDGENRYRLKIYSKDGNYYYSSEKTARYPVIDPIHAYPNPVFEGELNLEIDQPFTEDVRIEIYNLEGKSVYQQLVKNTPEDLLKVKVSIDDYSEGIYFLRIVNGQRVFSKKFEVVK